MVQARTCRGTADDRLSRGTCFTPNDALMTPHGSSCYIRGDSLVDLCFDNWRDPESVESPTQCNSLDAVHNNRPRTATARVVLH
jgi:hypothetical protein